MLINVLEYLEGACRRFPERTALESETAQLSFAELCRQGLGVARQVRARHAGIREPVLVYLEKSPPAIVGMVGALMSGNCYCPVDTKLPAPRLAAIVGNLAPVAVVTSRALEGQVRGAGVPAERIILVDDL